EVAQHLLGDIEVGNHAVLEGTDRLDPFGRTPQHPLCLESDALDASGRLLDRDDRGFVEDDSFTLHIDQRIGGAEIDGDLVCREEGAELEQVHDGTAGVRIAVSGCGRPRKVAAGSPMCNTLQETGLGHLCEYVLTDPSR